MRAEACIGDVLALIPVTADKDTYPAGAACHLSNEPSCGPAKLPIVGADVARTLRGGLVGDVGDNRLAPSLECLDGLANQRMVRRDQGRGVAAVAEGHQSRGDVP